MSFVSKVVDRLMYYKFNQERHYRETHTLVWDAFTLARQINRSDYVNQRMYVADLLLQRPNK
jgi:hypothetical protein